MQTMDDGVPIAFTRYTPDGAAPAAGRPGVIVLHGLAGNRGSVDAISSAFANAGYSVLAYDARGHGTSGGEITLAGPREVADLRALRSAFAARPEVSDTIGAWGISYGGGQIWNALAAGVPFAAVEVVETWTSLYDALWPQNLARSGIVAGFAAGIAARSPLVAGIRDDAVQSRNLGAVKALTAARSALAARLGSISTPVYLFQGQDRLRLRPDAGDLGLRAARRAEEALRRQLRPPALDVPRHRQRLRALAGRRLVRPLPEGDAERRRREAGRDREAGLGDGARRARRAAGARRRQSFELRGRVDGSRQRGRLAPDRAAAGRARDLGHAGTARVTVPKLDALPATRRHRPRRQPRRRPRRPEAARRASTSSSSRTTASTSRRGRACASRSAPPRRRARSRTSASPAPARRRSGRAP